MEQKPMTQAEGVAVAKSKIDTTRLKLCIGMAISLSEQVTPKLAFIAGMFFGATAHGKDTITVRAFCGKDWTFKQSEFPTKSLRCDCGDDRCWVLVWDNVFESEGKTNV